MELRMHLPKEVPCKLSPEEWETVNHWREERRVNVVLEPLQDFKLTRDMIRFHLSDITMDFFVEDESERRKLKAERIVRRLLELPV